MSILFLTCLSGGILWADSLTPCAVFNQDSFTFSTLPFLVPSFIGHPPGHLAKSWWSILTAYCDVESFPVSGGWVTPPSVIWKIDLRKCHSCGVLCRLLGLVPGILHIWKACWWGELWLDSKNLEETDNIWASHFNSGLDKKEVCLS